VCLCVCERATGSKSRSVFRSVPHFIAMYHLHMHHFILCLNASACKCMHLCWESMSYTPLGVLAKQRWCGERLFDMHQACRQRPLHFCTRCVGRDHDLYSGVWAETMTYAQACGQRLFDLHQACG